MLGLVLSTVGVVAVAQALIRAPDIGWSAPSTLLGLVGGTLALAAFTVWQHHSRTPMMPLEMFRTVRQVGAVFGVAVAVAVFSTFGGYGSPQQFVDGFGPTVTVLAAITLAGLVPAALIRPRRSRSVSHPQEEAYETA